MSVFGGVISGVLGWAAGGALLKSLIETRRFAKTGHIWSAVAFIPFVIFYAFATLLFFGIGFLWMVLDDRTPVSETRLIVQNVGFYVGSGCWIWLWLMQVRAVATGNKWVHKYWFDLM